MDESGADGPGVDEAQALVAGALVEEARAGPEDDREDDQPQLVDQVMRDQRPREPVARRDDDLPVQRLLEPLPFELPEPTRRGEPLWLEPYPDAWLAEPVPGPETRFEQRETVTLAFVAAIQRLPSRQRAVLVLRDVLGFHAAEVAEMLDSSAVSVNSALQRARATLETRPFAGTPGPRSPRERELAGRFADAVESGDVDRMVALLTDDALLTMPPIPLEYQGREAIAGFLRFREQARGTPLRLVPTRANAQPAFGCYTPDARTGIARASGLFVLTLEGEAVAAMTWFADPALFAPFGLAPTAAWPRRG